ncbi:MAG: N-acetylglucosamine-6-phosphate deacetylase [Spirosomataceae bacterium]|jgi:N-acetylglucosamine-6-phosphate deacetylase
MLAGSAQSLLQCVEHLINSGILPMATALDLASLKPGELLKSNFTYGLRHGAKTDLTCFERTAERIKIIKTIKSGEVIYEFSE